MCAARTSTALRRRRRRWRRGARRATSATRARPLFRMRLIAAYDRSLFTSSPVGFESILSLAPPTASGSRRDVPPPTSLPRFAREHLSQDYPCRHKYRRGSISHHSPISRYYPMTLASSPTYLPPPPSHEPGTTASTPTSTRGSASPSTSSGAPPRRSRRPSARASSGGCSKRGC